MGDSDLMTGAKRIAATLKGPIGQIKLTRVVGQHLHWFEDVRSRGMTWDQIITVLTAAGATRADGTPFARGHVSSAVWRARKGISRPKPTGPESASATTSVHTKQRSRPRKSAESSGSKIPRRDRGPKDAPTEEQCAPTSGVQTNPDKADLMRLMRRAAKLRTSAGDEGG
jgi:hypothetical protein